MVNVESAADAPLESGKRHFDMDAMDKIEAVLYPVTASGRRRA